MGSELLQRLLRKVVFVGRAEYDDGFAFDLQHALRFQFFQHASYHFARTADDAGDFLAGDSYLDSGRVVHRAGLLTEFQ